VLQWASVDHTCLLAVCHADPAQPQLPYISADCCTTALSDSLSASVTHPALHSHLLSVTAIIIIIIIIITTIITIINVLGYFCQLPSVTIWEKNWLSINKQMLFLTRTTASNPTSATVSWQEQLTIYYDFCITHHTIQTDHKRNERNTNTENWEFLSCCEQATQQWVDS